MGSERLIGELYSEILCLESFSQINNITINVLAKKICRTNKMDKELKPQNLLEILNIESYNFYKGTQIEDLKKHIWVIWRDIYVYFTIFL